MRLDNITNERILAASTILSNLAKDKEPVKVKFIDLGVRIIRLECHSKKFMTQVERQMGIALRDSAERWDATLVIWQEPEIANVSFSILSDLNPDLYRELRVLKLIDSKKIKDRCNEQIVYYNEEVIRFWPYLNIDPQNSYLTAWNPKTNTYFYAEQNLEPEELVKRGHLFVQLLFRICNISGSSLAHGAVIGLNNCGILFCGFGYRGKSTLCVQALIDNFEYVSDDYFILAKKDYDILRAYPIYSMVALAPEPYESMYSEFNGKFLSMNGRKDKYLFNVSSYHSRFKYNYPIKIAMYLNICDTNEPSIIKGARAIAIEELCFSTLNNTGNQRDAETVGKLYGFVKDLPFYKFNLSKDYKKNILYLRNFIQNFI